MTGLEKGTEVVALVNGEEIDGRVIEEYVENGIHMVSMDTEEPHWATGEYGADAPREDVRVL